MANLHINFKNGKSSKPDSSVIIDYLFIFGNGSHRKDANFIIVALQQRNYEGIYKNAGFIPTCTDKVSH